MIECLAYFYPELNESSLIDEVMRAEWKKELFFPPALSKITIVSSSSEKIAAS